MTTSTRLEAGNETGSERRAASASTPVSPGGEGRGEGGGITAASLGQTATHHTAVLRGCWCGRPREKRQLLPAWPGSATGPPPHHEPENVTASGLWRQPVGCGDSQWVVETASTEQCD